MLTEDGIVALEDALVVRVQRAAASEGDVATRRDAAVALVLGEVYAPAVAHGHAVGTRRRFRLHTRRPGVTGRSLAVVALARGRCGRRGRAVLWCKDNIERRVAPRLDADVLDRVAACEGEGAVCAFAVEARLERRFQPDAVRARGKPERVSSVGLCACAVGACHDLIDGDDHDVRDARRRSARRVEDATRQTAALLRVRGRREREQEQDNTRGRNEPG